MSKKFFLPIKSGNDGNMQLPEIGRWEERKNVFRNISSAIAGDEYSIPARVHSIPDMWARPLLFETALLDEKHPKHKSVVEEWRGLLATLALSQYADIDLEYVPVRFDNNQSLFLSRSKAST